MRARRYIFTTNYVSRVALVNKNMRSTLSHIPCISIFATWSDRGETDQRLVFVYFWQNNRYSNMRVDPSKSQTLILFIYQIDAFPLVHANKKWVARIRLVNKTLTNSKFDYWSPTRELTSVTHLTSNKHNYIINSAFGYFQCVKGALRLLLILTSRQKNI